MTKYIYNIGASHRSANIEFRENLYVPESEVTDHITAVKSDFQLTEVFALSTCNRVELFYVCEQSDHHHGAKILSSFVKKTDVSERDILQNSHFFEQSTAIHHMMAVTASLDSVIVGETQITGQIKEAAEIARSANCLGSILERLFQESLGVAKRVRSETAIGAKTVSISHAALDLSKMVFSELNKTRILVIGAGEMARIAAKYALSYSPFHLTICNRTIERAEEIVKEIGGGEAVGLDELEREIIYADIILSATASTSYIVTKTMVQSIIHKRSRRPLFIADIAIPRDIDPDLKLMEDIYLFDVDDLKQVVDEHIDERRAAAIKAEVIIHEGTENFNTWLNRLAIKPTLAAFHQHLHSLMQKELDKTLSKEIFMSLTAEQKEALQRMIEASSRKISSDAAKIIQTTESNEKRADFADALKRMFLEKEPS
jgi:glutamyl-tRNA reductase